jgi:DNA-directed RNA polymerase beta subunit
MSYKGYNFEDGFVVSQNFLKKYNTTELEKITVIVPPDVNVTKIATQLGAETTQG